ncbi:hypothetical protein [Rhizomonospora bruguierae]|uniref:hypothetical protein n=1 Tax=Rhizomonospora bruguierae TaxID=1581705 RepID=UPI001BCD6A21|nr:hypothetical protein [Micromonospora sp. NBRC 107566]
MGSLGGGNGDNWPPDGGGQSEGLPGLPPEWGQIIIPDDLAALADESAAVRRELRRAARVAHLRRLAGLPPPPRPGVPPAAPSVRLPLIIMVLAVVATLASLFLVTWSGPGRRSGVPTTLPHQSGARLAVPRLTLTDDRGDPISLRELLPAVLLLTEGCDCATLVRTTADAAPPGVSVIAIERTPPALATAPPPFVSGTGGGGGVPAAPGASAPGAGPSSPGVGPTAEPPAPVRTLVDQSDALRTQLDLPGPGPGAVVLLADREGTLVRTVVAASSVEDYRSDLSRLAGR